MPSSGRSASNVALRTGPTPVLNGIVRLFSPSRARSCELADLIILVIDLTIELVNVFADLCANSACCTAGPILLSHTHLHQMASASNQDRQFLRRSIW